MTIDQPFGPVDLPTLAAWDSPTLSRIVPVLTERRADLFAECDLWVACVRGAEADAEILARGAPLPGDTGRISARHLQAVHNIRNLRAWATEHYVGSLAWCSEQLSGAAGIELEPERVRARILSLLRVAERRSILRPRKARIVVREAA